MTCNRKKTFEKSCASAVGHQLSTTHSLNISRTSLDKIDDKTWKRLCVLFYRAEMSAIACCHRIGERCFGELLRTACQDLTCVCEAISWGKSPERPHGCVFHCTESLGLDKPCADNSSQFCHLKRSFFARHQTTHALDKALLVTENVVFEDKTEEVMDVVVQRETALFEIVTPQSNFPVGLAHLT